MKTKMLLLLGSAAIVGGVFAYQKYVTAKQEAELVPVMPQPNPNWQPIPNMPKPPELDPSQMPTMYAGGSNTFNESVGNQSLTVLDPFAV